MVVNQIWSAINNNVSLIILTIFVIIIFIKTCLSNESFFSVRSILKYYFTIFKKPKNDSELLDVKQGKNHYYIEPILFNFALPTIVGIFLGIVHPINSTIITFMSTVISIWIAILFALVAVIQSLAKEKLGESYFKVVKQAYATVMFECCISIMSVVLGFIYIILCPQDNAQAVQFPLSVILILFSIVIYTLLFVLLLTMFMIFKKCNALLGEIIKANETQKRDVTLINILNEVKKIQESIKNDDKKNK
jgi:hypothetical protein